MAFADLSSFLAHLERRGDLHRVGVEVDPEYEIAEIARIIGCAPGTIKIHLQHIFAKLGTGDRTEAVTIAYQRGYLHLDD